MLVDEEVALEGRWLELEMVHDWNELVRMLCMDEGSFGC